MTGKTFAFISRGSLELAKDTYTQVPSYQSCGLSQRPGWRYFEEAKPTETIGAVLARRLFRCCRCEEGCGFSPVCLALQLLQREGMNYREGSDFLTTKDFKQIQVVQSVM